MTTFLLPFSVHLRLTNEPDFQQAFGDTHGRAIFRPENRTWIYWPKPVHLLIRTLHCLYLFWFRWYIWPLAKHVIPEGNEVFALVRWVTRTLEWHAEAPTLKVIEQETGGRRVVVL